MTGVIYADDNPGLSRDRPAAPRWPPLIREFLSRGRREARLAQLINRPASAPLRQVQSGWVCDVCKRLVSALLEDSRETRG